MRKTAEEIAQEVLEKTALSVANVRNVLLHADPKRIQNLSRSSPVMRVATKGGIGESERFLQELERRRRGLPPVDDLADIERYARSIKSAPW